MKRQRPVFRWLFLIPLLLVGFQIVQADLEIPEVSDFGFIQTNGPNAQLNVGDWWTNDEGAAQTHQIIVHIPCTPNITYFFDLFDPEMNNGGNPPGTGAVLDEVRDDSFNQTNDNAFADDTFFRLYNGTGGAPIANQTYTPFGGSDGNWELLYQLDIGATPVDGFNCGEFRIEAETGDNDENGWRLRLRDNNPDGLPASLAAFSELGRDRVPATGDEPWIGLQSVSYQHAPAGQQTFYWFVDEGEQDLYMVNFDLDNAATVTYTMPNGQTVTGTTSRYAADGPTGTGWNSNPMTDTYPDFADMNLFDPDNGDFAGDAVVNPLPGLWTATLDVSESNQYTFEVANKLVFMRPPELPQLIIDKTDGVTTVTSPGTTTYTITITNIGDGAAMPIPGPEVVDTLPPDMTFVSCAVNAPLVGTCSEAGGVVNVELQGQTGMSAYLPGSGHAGNSGTITLTANINPGLPANTQLENIASVDWTGIFGNNYLPVSDNDIDVVSGPPPPTPTPDPGDGGSGGEEGDSGEDTAEDLSLGTLDALPGNANVSAGAEALAQAGLTFSKSVDPPFALPGDRLTWTLTVSNVGAVAVDDVRIEDSVPDALQILSASSTIGTVTVDGQKVAFTLDTLPPRTTATVTIISQVRTNAGISYVLENSAQMISPVQATTSATVLSVTSLPRTGEPPWWRGPLLAMLLIVPAGGFTTGLWLWYRRRKRA